MYSYNIPPNSLGNPQDRCERDFSHEYVLVRTFSFLECLNSGPTMKHSKLSVAAAVCAMFGIGAASAADLPMKAPPSVPAPVVGWTGWYVGLNAGGIWPNSNGVTHTALAGPCNAAFAGCGTGFSTTLATGSIFNAGFGNNAGFTGGGQFGYNWQFNGTGVAG